MTTSSSQLLYLADDHIIVANALLSLVQSIDPSIEVQLFPNGKALFDACEVKQPDMVMLDIEMPIWDGRKTLAELKNRYPSLPCLILSITPVQDVLI